MLYLLTYLLTTAFTSDSQSEWELCSVRLCPNGAISKNGIITTRRRCLWDPSI